MAIKKVAVIGAGVSGLTAMKACEEQGMDATCFEMHDDIGGIWYYTEYPRKDEGAVIYDFLITNTSREMMRFSDFHFPPDTPPFPQHQHVHNYLHSYADKFGLKSKIQLNTKVVELKKADDYEETGQWVIKTQKVGDTSVVTQTFDAVMYCIGFHRKPFIPEIEGLKEFKGDWSHSNTFKTGKVYKDKRVLVIGNANSACDAAVGISEYAKQVYLSIGRGAWIFPRYADNVPIDASFVKRIYFKVPPVFVSNKLQDIADKYYNNVEFGLRPEAGPLHLFPVANDDIGSRIASGKIKVMPRSVRFLQHGVMFEDGTEINDIDHVMFATGFLQDTTLIGEDSNDAYKKVFPLKLKKNTFAMIGIVSCLSAVPPVAEMQARFASLVFAGKHKLPDKSVMEKDVAKWKAIQEEFFGPGRHWCPALPLTDEIAEEIGVLPNFMNLLFRSPKVAFQTIFGPAFIAQYRLQGDGAIDSALDDCKKAWNLTSQGVKLRQVPTLKSDLSWLNFHVLMFVLLSVVVVIVGFFIASWV